MQRVSGAALAAAMLGLAGCGALFAVYQPGNRVTPEVAAQWGCDHDAVMAQAEERRADKRRYEMWEPQVGWDACEVLASVGHPSSIEVTETQEGLRASWRYDEPIGTRHRVVLAQEAGNRWIVNYAAW